MIFEQDYYNKLFGCYLDEEFVLPEGVL
jgi:hypothetical protein